MCCVVAVLIVFFFVFVVLFCFTGFALFSFSLIHCWVVVVLLVFFFLLFCRFDCCDDLVEIPIFCVYIVDRSRPSQHQIGSSRSSKHSISRDRHIIK